MSDDTGYASVGDEHSSGVRVARLRAKRAREAYEAWLREHGARTATEAAPTFSDCAALWWQSAVAFGTAAAEGQAGHPVQAASWAAQGQELEDAAQSCDTAAGGGTIRL